jgi:hypothetical protein
MIKAPKSSSSKAKSTRSIEARIAQLEGLHKSRDEILVVWRLPGAQVSKALRNLDYGPGDRVVCFEWFGTSPPPQPQWRSDLRHWQSKEESDSIDIMIKRILDAKPDRRQAAGTGRTGSDHDELERCSDEEIFYLLFGVPDGRMIRKL